MAAPLQKAQERLALHEVIRVGVGRQEDLRLLQNVALQACCLPPASVAQLLREAALREEWRAGREAALLESLRSLSLASLAGGGCLSAADGRLLAEQVAALTEMLEQQQQQRRQQRAAGTGQRLGTSHRGRGGPGTSKPAGAVGSSDHNSVGALPSLGGALRGYQGTRPHSRGRQAAASGSERPGRQRPPSTPSGASTHPGLARSTSAGCGFGSLYDTGADRAQQRQRLAGGSAPAATVAAAAAIYGAGPAVVRTPARELRSSNGGGRRTSGPETSGAAGTGASSWGGQRQYSPQARATHGSAYGRPRPRPGSAPQELFGEEGEMRPGTAAAAAAAASAAAAAAAAVAVNAPGATGGGIGSGRNERSSGFRNLLRLQQLLMQGLRDHAQEEGEGGALEALAASVAEGQAFFADCLADALEAAGLPQDAAGGRTAQAGGGGGPTRRLPLVAWDKLLRLGQLGLTRADVARLEQIRRQQAARVIQRRVRRWLRRRWHQRRLAEARARADTMQRRLRERAAVVVQAWVRGHLARRRAARLRVQVAGDRVAQRRAAAARVQAATTIQRAWRGHLRAVRYAAALARAEERRRQEQQQQRQQQRQQQQQRAEASQGSTGGGPVAQAPGQRQQQPRGAAGSSRLSQEQAVVVIQSHLRGWLVRRGSALWWARASHSLRERRAAVRAWRQHQRFMAASYDMQAQLLGAMVREAQVAEALQADRRRQEAEMQVAFNEWLLQQQRVALSQPLPRGWVPHPHPEDAGRTCFLNTRTGELHSLHPAVAELARHAHEQHAAAAAALQQRFAGVPAYQQQLHEATAQQADIAMRAIALMYQRAATPGGGTGAKGRAGSV